LKLIYYQKEIGNTSPIKKKNIAYYRSFQMYFYGMSCAARKIDVEMTNNMTVPFLLWPTCVFIIASE